MSWKKVLNTPRNKNSHTPKIHFIKNMFIKVPNLNWNINIHTTIEETRNHLFQFDNDFQKIFSSHNPFIKHVILLTL